MTFDWTNTENNVTFSYNNGYFYVDATNAVNSQYYTGFNFSNFDFYFKPSDVVNFVNSDPFLLNIKPQIFSNILINISG